MLMFRLFLCNLLDKIPYIYIDMKLLQALVLLLAISAIAAQPMQIFSASTMVDSTSGPLSGSLLGGTTIYIKGVGFPTDVNKIKIYIGNYQCKIPADGLTPTTISCQTSSSGSMTNKHNLPIQIVLNEQIFGVQGYTFSYLSSATPYLNDIYPMSSPANKILNFYGVHRVLNSGDGARDVGDFLGLYVGASTCGLFDIVQAPISYNGNSRVQCLQARDQQAGKYNISEHVVAGWASKQWYMQRASFSKQYYQFTVLPGVNSISPNNGAVAGQDLVITGTGFSKDKSKISVSIDGVTCNVLSSTTTQINCRVAQKLPSMSAALPSNSAQTVANNYISGVGFVYQRFDFTNLVDKSVNGFRNAYNSNLNASQLTLTEKGIATQLRSMDTLGQYYCQVYKGYFYAPVAGRYIFRGAADDQFALYMSSEYGTTNTTLLQEIYSNYVSYAPDNYYVTNFSSALGQQKTLQAGKYYYMEAYHINFGGPGYFKISVQVPNTDTSLVKKRFEVNQIQTKFTNDPEIMKFTLDGVSGGKFNLSIYRVDSKTLQVTYNKQVQINFNATAAQFQNALNQFDLYSTYQTTCTGVEAFDQSGASVSSSSATATKFVWTVSVNLLRPDTITAQKFITKLSTATAAPGSTPAFTELRTKVHGPLISGTFTMEMGGIPIKVYDPVTGLYSNPFIPFNVTDYSLAMALKQISGFDKVDVYRKNDPNYGATWIISYLQYSGNVPDIILSASQLSGGAAGTFPSIQFFQTRPYSTNLIFNPVDENFLFMPARTANVLVTVNGVQSVCLNNCQYTFLPNTPVVLTQVLSGSTVTATISNPQNYVIDTSILWVKVDGKQCQVAPGPSFTSFSCQLPQNSDGSPVLRAGQHNVQVILGEVGVVPLNTGVLPMYYGLTISSVSPNSGANNGGNLITLTGNGYPSAISDAKITMCGMQVDILSITNTQTVFYAPECSGTGSQTITYQYNGQTATGQYNIASTASPSSIFSVSPVSASPVLKAVMTITGTGFGTNISAVKVHLANSTGRIYPMRVLSINDTQIKCGIPGGLPGKFDVKVSIDGQGDIVPANVTADDFVYQLVIESITPTQTAYHGGTLITITGRNFSPDILQNLVYVGNQLNWLCSIQSLSRTQIKCRTPATHPDWKSNTQGIIVGNRLIQDSTCQNNNCFVTYGDNVTSPNITSISSSQIVSGVGSIVLTGYRLNLIAAADVQVVLQNSLTRSKTVVVPTSVSAGSLTFAAPSVQAGNYKVRVRLDPIGQTNSLNLIITTALSATVYSASVKGGRIILTGQGLPSTWPSKLFNIKILTNKFYINPEVVSASPKKLQIKLPQGSNNQVYNITLTNPVQQTITATLTQSSTSTPKISILTASPLPAGTQTIQINRTTLANQNPDSIAIYPVLSPEKQINVPNWAYSASIISFSHSFEAGRFGLRVYYARYGYADVLQFVDVSAPSAYTAASTDSSYFGGQLTVTGNSINPSSVIKVGGFQGHIISQTATQAVFAIPNLPTPTTISTYPELGVVQKIQPKALIADSAQGKSYSFDTIHSTYYQSTNADCHVGIDSGAGTLVNLKRIRYFPYHAWTIAASYIKGAVFQGSIDGVTYTKLATIDQTVHAGWNSIVFNINQNYRFFRFSHNSTSKCKLAQFQVFGILLNDVSVSSMASFPIDAVFSDGFNTYTFSQAVTYRVSQTPVITDVSPATGSIYGNQLVSLTGTNLNIGTASIIIDGIDCLVNAVASSSTHLQCTTQARPNLPQANTFKVTVGGKVALLKEQFIYVMRWSDIRTWGTDLPPIQGDLVYVPKGMALYVDQSTPRLDGIVVQDGKLIFADEGPMQIHTNLITVNRGEFRAGTQKKPYQNKLTFVMYGSYYGKQQPMFGNKGIGCMQCKFSMYGQPRVKTWTLLASTVAINATTLTVTDTVDWQVGQQIVVASTDFDHNQAEQRTITAISGNLITVNQTFKFKHFAGVETYGNDRLEMRAQVGLLTRNIKMMGDPTSQAGEYGSHLMMAGSSQSGMTSHIAYTQFTHCGQPRIVGRYCIHFHMNGDVANSFAKGNAVHHSFARVITLHGVQYLHVSQNVGYRVKGHNFFIEDGIQTQNVIENNLVIGSLQSWNMMQTDISVASFWVTNPTNHLRNNRAAGGDFYGFWYEIKPHPDGPSATMDICPTGNPLGESHDNVAHSYKRFGLRIFKLWSRQNPCQGSLYWMLADPWSHNPSVQSKFYNYLLYKNGQAGLLAEQVGNMIFQNFTIAESKHAGMEFYLTNFTKQMVEAKDSVIIGLTQTNTPSVSKDSVALRKSSGVIGPRTYGWGMSGIRFYSFGSQTTILQTCSQCDNDLLVTNTANQYVISNISFSNVTGNYLYMGGMKRQIVYDLDGSFVRFFNGGTRTSATIVYSFKHITQQSACTAATDPALWNNAVVCDQSIKIRKLKFMNLKQRPLFLNNAMKIQLLSDVNEVVPSNSTDFQEIYSVYYGMEPMVDHKQSYSVAFVAGRTYNIWWHTGIDFSQLHIQISTFFDDSDPGIILKFNYTQNRQLFEVGQLVNGYIEGNLTTVTMNSTLDETNCTYGDYTHDVDNQTMTLCLTSRNRVRPYQSLEVIGVKCRYICPSDTNQYVMEKFIRLWSNATQWPNQVVPLDGENVTIPGEWTILVDIQPAPMDSWIIKGNVVVPNNILNVRLRAKNIWIVSGSLKAGQSPTAPYTGQLTIELLGNKEEQGIVIDPLTAGNKMFVVTGRLILYGQVPATTWTKLTSIARRGDTSIQVLSTSGWKVGDQITIAPSFTTASEHEKVIITSISGTTVSFSPALKYTHYGDPAVTITNAVGTLDTRAGVGLLTRNIKIVAGQDSGWGFHLLVYGYIDNLILRTGSITLHGVELFEGGQYDTHNSALKLLNTVGTNPVNIYKSSFHQCKSLCLDINNINNANIDQNVFYNGRLFLVRANQVDQYSFTNNLMISAIKRPTLTSGAKQLISCYATYTALHNVTASVRHNLCQGSDSYGFVLPYVPCQMVDTPPYEDNTAGSARFGHTFNKIPTNCLGGSGAKSYACFMGHMGHSPTTKTKILSKFMITDSNRGVTLRFGIPKNDDDNTMFFKDSYISAISRPSCTECYGPTAIPCTDGRGIRMLTVTINGQSLPHMFGDDFDIICRQEVFDAKAFLSNVIFQNFKINYPGLQCYNNTVFQPHKKASDLTGSHHLTDTVCNNCQFSALARFSAPDPKDLGWFGGCGKIHCTGRNNYLITDYTGSYLGSPGFLLANNSQIGDNTDNCTFDPIMNGHFCRRLDFSVIQYESIAPDFNTRIMWPVYLKFDGGRWNTSTNGWRQWEWDGNEPLNKRLARFISVVQVNQIYNMTFESQPPIDMRFQFQRRTVDGNNSEWIVIKIHHPVPNSIRVQNKGIVIKPISLLDNNGQNDLDRTVCGSNKFFYQNYTIYFVLTADKNCQVRVSLTNSIQLTARFSMDINDFFNADGQTKFIDRMCAVLGIVDTSRLKIVGIYNGSVVIHAFIDESRNTTTENATQNNNDMQKQEIKQLADKLSQLYSSGNISEELTAVGLGPLIQLNSQTYFHVYDPEETMVELQPVYTALVIGLVLGFVAIISIIIAGIIYIKKRETKILNLNAQVTETKIQQTIIQNYSVDDFAHKRSDLSEDKK